MNGTLKKFVAIVLLSIFSIINVACGNSHGNTKEMTLVGMQEGLCNGAGEITWDMGHEDILMLDGAYEDNSGDIVFEDIVFHNCSGSLECDFNENELTRLIFTLEGDSSYSDFNSIRQLLIDHYGEPTYTISVDEVYEQNSGWPIDFWGDGIYTSNGERIIVDLESKFEKGWSVLVLINSPKK